MSEQEVWEKLFKAREEIGGLKSKLEFLHKEIRKIRNCCKEEANEYRIVNELEGCNALTEFQVIIEKTMRRLGIDIV